VAAPLNLGDGSEQLGVIITLGAELGKTTVIVSGLLKLVSVAIALGFGFIGGPVFPMIFAGACLGVAAHLIVPGLPFLVAVPSCLVAIACATLPGLFSMTVLSSMIFVLGGSATTPVFVACVMSYSTVSGMGLVQNLLMKAIAKQKAATSGTDGNEEERIAAGGWSNPLLQSSFPLSKPRQSAGPSKPEDSAPAVDGSSGDPMSSA
jgi:H+/Cl- antiporter ClcA